MKRSYLLYGDEKVEIKVPDGADILETADAPALGNIEAEVQKSLADPIGTPPLKTLLEQKKPRTAAVTISDITRAVPNRAFLPAILASLENAGVPRKNIGIIVGTGMHRPSTREEHIRLVGRDIYDAYRVIDHDARNPEGLVRVSDNPPVSVNAGFAGADVKIVTGFIEPHFMAGFSGGRKGVCPALVDLETVQKFHGFETLSSSKAAAGILPDNPCHEIALDVARKVGVDFLFNVTLNKDFAVSGIFCGDLEDAHNEGCRFAAKHAGCSVDVPYNLVVTNGGGYPFDCNYYQTVKGMCMALPAVKPGGTILQISECREGTGSAAFTGMLRHYENNWKRFLHDIEENKEETKLDQWEFQMLCRVLEKIGIGNLHAILGGVPEKERQFLCCTPLKPADDISRQVESTLSEYSRTRPDGRIAIIPAGPYTIIQ